MLNTVRFRKIRKLLRKSASQSRDRQGAGRAKTHPLAYARGSESRGPRSIFMHLGAPRRMEDCLEILRTPQKIVGFASPAYCKKCQYLQNNLRSRFGNPRVEASDNGSIFNSEGLPMTYLGPDVARQAAQRLQWSCPSTDAIESIGFHPPGVTSLACWGIPVLFFWVSPRDRIPLPRQ